MLAILLVLSLLLVAASVKITIPGKSAVLLVKRETSKAVDHVNHALGLRGGAVSPSDFSDEVKSIKFNARSFLKLSTLTSLALALGVLFASDQPKLMHVLNLPVEAPQSLLVWVAAGLVGWANGKHSASKTESEAKEYCQRNIIPMALLLGKSIIDGSADPLHYALFVPLAAADIYFGFIHNN